MGQRITRSVTLRLEPDLYDGMCWLAKARGISINAAGELAMRRGLDVEGAALMGAALDDEGERLLKEEGEMETPHECESCAESGQHGVPAVGHSRNPDWSGYHLCQECIEEYDQRAPVNSAR